MPHDTTGKNQKKTLYKAAKECAFLIWRIAPKALIFWVEMTEIF